MNSNQKTKPLCLEAMFAWSWDTFKCPYASVHVLYRSSSGTHWAIIILLENVLVEKSEAQNMGDFGPMTATKILWKAMPDAEVSKAAVLKRDNAISQLKNSSGKEIDGLH